MINQVIGVRDLGGKECNVAPDVFCVDCLAQVYLEGCRHNSKVGAQPLCD